MMQHSRPKQSKKNNRKIEQYKKQVHHISIKNFWFLRKSVALALILEKYSLNYFVVSFENGGVYFATAPFCYSGAPSKNHGERLFYSSFFSR